MPNDPEILLRELAIIRKCFATAMVSTWLLSSECSCELPDNTVTVRVGSVSIKPAVFAPEILGTTDEQKSELLGNFALLSLRVALRDSYRAIKEYAMGTDLLTALRREAWFLFLEAVRGSLEHSTITHTTWHNPRREKGLLCTWHGKSIDDERWTKPITFSYFSPEDAIELLEEAEEFIRRLPIGP
jgi:hypothetical protein